MSGSRGWWEMRWGRSLHLVLGNGEPWKVLEQASMWLTACGGTALLNIQCARESPGNLVKIQMLEQQA